jgi:hypothetical protein
LLICRKRTFIQAALVPQVKNRNIMKDDESQDQARRIVGETSLTRAILRNIRQYRNGSLPSPHYPLQQAQPLTRQNLGLIIQAALDLISVDLDLDLDDECEDLSQQEHDPRE